MTKLERLIKELCHTSVEFKKLSEIAELKRGTSITKKQITVGEIPVISGGKKPAYYCNNFNREGETITIAGSGANAGYVQYWTTPIFVCDAFSIKSLKCCKTKYIYYCMANMQDYIYSTKKGDGVPHVHISNVENIKIPVPPLSVQEEIVRILDELTERTEELISELNAELEARKKQYEHYKNKLMSVDSANIFKLGDIAFICDGTHQTPHYTDSGVKFISVENINDILNTTKYISIVDYDKYKVKPQIGDVFMTRIGSIGKCAVLDKQEDLAYYVTLALIRPNQNIVISKYLKYVIESMVGAKELRKRTLLNAVPIKINKDDIGKIELPIPSINSQEKIVAQIEKYDIEFDMLIRSISNEIENRKKQYEYYRDKLLTF